MVDTARLILSSKAPTRATRLGVVTVSGGAGVLICDAAHEAGLSVPPLSASVRTRLDGLLPAFVQRQNPVDVTGAVVSNARMLAGAVTALGESDDCDVIVLFYGAMGSIRDALVAAVRTAAACGKPVVVIWMGAPADARAAIEEMRIPVFPDIPPAIAALANAIHGCGGGPRGANA
jgi:acyl-CoA synthetase (NDP forming)